MATGSETWEDDSGGDRLRARAIDRRIFTGRDHPLFPFTQRSAIQTRSGFHATHGPDQRSGPPQSDEATKKSKQESGGRSRETERKSLNRSTTHRARRWRWREFRLIEAEVGALLPEPATRPHPVLNRHPERRRPAPNSRLRLDWPLGRGGMGVVFEGHSQRARDKIRALVAKAYETGRARTWEPAGWRRKCCAARLKPSLPRVPENDRIVPRLSRSVDATGRDGLGVAVSRSVTENSANRVQTAQGGFLCQPRL
jgi:hypothetical protein